MFDLPDALLLARIQFAFTVSFTSCSRPSRSGWRATWLCSKAFG